MNTIYNFFSTDWAYALGWALMHSIWQSLLIFIILLVCLHFISPMLSKLRYALTCGALILTLLSSIITFLYSVNHSISHTTVRNAPSGSMPFIKIETEKAKTTVQQIQYWAYQSLNENMPLIITAWVIGFLIFAMRLFNGFMYTYQLQTSVTPLHNQWTAYIRNQSKKMGITKTILFAESRQITTPMVIGYVKPVILVPVGMLIGLSAEQLETIIIHELAHIKRHDFLINAIQSILETAFFFNPFVWRISALIRREREFCCDDVVMEQHGASRAYANALAQLEEARLSKSMFALSLAENKNELLNRIKRIMEKSLKNHSGTGRIMPPVVLLIAGLLCASWLSVEQQTSYNDESLAVQDTTIRNNTPTKYSRKSIITIDKNGQPHEEIVEEFEGNENLRPMIEMELVPDVRFSVPAFPSIDVMPVIPLLDFDALPDSLPLPRFGFREREEWEEFSKAFEDEFRENFQDFYSSHEKDLKAVMEELEQNFMSQEFESIGIPSQDLESLNKELERIGGFREQILEQLNHFDHQGEFKDLRQDLETLHENLEHVQLDNQNLHSHLWDFNIHEKELRKMLIEDGYMSEDESMETLELNDEVLKINGVKIKAGDRKKYEDLLNKRGNLEKIE